MTEWTIEMVLNRALSLEKQSYNLYIWAKGRVKNIGIKKMLNELAQEERRHKEKIVSAIKNRERISEIGSNIEEVEDLGIIDWLSDAGLSENATYQDILIYAGKREKETYEYYLDLSERFGKNEIGKLFLNLAQEELKHKNRIEREYEKNILKEM